MENTILMQVYSFITYLVSGMLIGIFFDIFRILRKSFKTPDIITYIEDIIFWLFTGLFLIFILFQINNGEIRIYNIVALILGGIFYMLSISKLFIKISVSIVTCIKNIVYKIVGIILSPIKFILKILRKLFTPFTFFVINIKKGSSNFGKKVHKIVKKDKEKEKISRERRIFKRNVEKYN